MADTLKKLSKEFADTVETAGNSIVRVEGRRRLPATGFVWDENTIITAHHVLERNEGITIGLPNGDTVEATLIGRDPGTDIAILRATHNLKPLTRTEEILRVGNLVFAVGRPGQQIQTTLGIVSAIGMDESQKDSRREERHKRMEERARHRAERMARRGMAYSFTFSAGSSGVMNEGAIQTDVVMYPGFSGGPLIDAGGFVRGMNTSGIARGISLTVPAKTIDRITRSLLEHGKIRQGYLGIGAQPVRLQPNLVEQTNQDTGLLIVSVESDSPADKGGLLVGDIIVAFDGQTVRHLDELLALLNGDRVDNEVDIHLIRGGALTSTKVTVGERA